MTLVSIWGRAISRAPRCNGKREISPVGGQFAFFALFQEPRAAPGPSRTRVAERSGGLHAPSVLVF